MGEDDIPSLVSVIFPSLYLQLFLELAVLFMVS